MLGISKVKWDANTHTKSCRKKARWKNKIQQAVVQQELIRKPSFSSYILRNKPIEEVTRGEALNFHKYSLGLLISARMKHSHLSLLWLLKPNTERKLVGIHLFSLHNSNFLSLSFNVRKRQDLTGVYFNDDAMWWVHYIMSFDIKRRVPV